jgi:hypothetical protein
VILPRATPPRPEIAPSSPAPNKEKEIKKEKK